MTRPRVRFTLFDAMGLVAATALGLALARAIDPGGLTPRPGFVVRWLVYGPSTCLAGAVAVALLILARCRPRALRRRLLRQPGLAACGGSLGAMALGIACNFYYRAVQTNAVPGLSIFPTGGWWFNAYNRVPVFVLGVWLALGLTGRWSPGRNWIDRSGRALGVFWLFQLVYGDLAPFVR